MDLLNITRRYLQTLYSSPALQYPPAQLTVSLACVLYLISSLDLVDPRLPHEAIRSKVVQSFHDLQPYANDHWLDHLSALKALPKDPIPSEFAILRLSLRQGLERLTERHNELATITARNAQDNGDSLPSAIADGWIQLGFSAATQSLLNRASSYRSKFAEGDQVGNCSCMYTPMLAPSFLRDSDYALNSRWPWARRPNIIFKYSGPLSKHTGGVTTTR